MKNLKLTFIYLFLITSLNVLGADPCQGKNRSSQNSWIVTLNKEDQAYKEDIVKSLRLMTTGGFKGTTLLAYQQNKAIFMTLTYDPSYWGSPQKASLIKKQALEKLALIQSTKIECNNRTTQPYPRMGGSN